MPITVYQHPRLGAMSEPPPADPREQAVEIPRNYVPPTEEEWERLAATNGLGSLILKYGARRVQRWVRNLAAIHGMECD